MELTPEDPSNYGYPNLEKNFATNMRIKARVMIHAQWMVTTYDRGKSYVPNPNSEIGRKCGIWKKPEKVDDYYWYY